MRMKGRGRKGKESRGPKLLTDGFEKGKGKLGKEKERGRGGEGLKRKGRSLPYQ